MAERGDSFIDYGDLSNVITTTEQLRVSPDIAAGLLRHNSRGFNRRVREKAIDRWSLLLRTGQWHPLNPGGRIILMAEFADGSRQLLDAQHRLMTIERTGISMDMELRLFTGITHDQAWQLFVSLDTGEGRDDRDRIEAIQRTDRVKGIADYHPSHIIAGIRAVLFADVLLPEGKKAYRQAITDTSIKDKVIRHATGDILCAATLRDLTVAGTRAMPIGILAAAIKAQRISDPGVAAMAREFFYYVVRLDLDTLEPGTAEGALRQTYAHKTQSQNLEVQTRLFGLAKTAWRRYCRYFTEGEKAVNLLRPESGTELYVPTAEEVAQHENLIPEVKERLASVWAGVVNVAGQQYVDGMAVRGYLQTRNGTTELDA